MTPGTPSEKREAEPDSAKPTDPCPPPTTAGTARPALPAGFVVATHAVLFEPEEARCDACNGPLTSAEGDEDNDEAAGHGLYVWARDGVVLYEEPPLCSACASAITISALQRWEIDEEEG
jgi:hypothetical protein